MQSCRLLESFGTLLFSGIQMEGETCTLVTWGKLLILGQAQLKPAIYFFPCPGDIIQYKLGIFG